MGKQKSFIRIEGGVGGVSFFKNSDGYQAREKGGVSKKRIEKDPKFARTRENMSEFSEAARSARLLRSAIKLLVDAAKDGTASRRLTKLMGKILRTDTNGLRGERKVSEGNMALLQDFEFNEQFRVREVLGQLITANIDRATGTLSAEIASFVPKQILAAPEGTSHIKLVTGGAAVDFASGAYVSEGQESAMLPWNLAPTGVINLVSQVTPGSTHVLFVVVGVQFFQEINGIMYELGAPTSNGLAIIKMNSL
jgi:hypothetical protein